VIVKEDGRVRDGRRVLAAQWITLSNTTLGVRLATIALTRPARAPGLAVGTAGEAGSNVLTRFLNRLLTRRNDPATTETEAAAIEEGYVEEKTETSAVEKLGGFHPNDLISDTEPPAPPPPST
jgi:hypothetical protein